MCSRPDCPLYVVVAGPRRVRVHEARIRRRKDVIVRSDRAPYLSFGHATFKIIAIVKAGQYAASDLPLAREDGTSAGVWLILARPQRFADSSRVGGRRVLAVHQRIVHA